MKVAVLPIVIDALITVTKGVVLGLGNMRTSRDFQTSKDNIIKIDQNTEKSPGDLVGTCYYSNYREKPLANVTVKNSQKSKIIVIIIIIIRDKYLDLAGELRTLWNMRVTVISIVISAFGTVSIDLKRGLEELESEGRAETIQTSE